MAHACARPLGVVVARHHAASQRASPLPSAHRLAPFQLCRPRCAAWLGLASDASAGIAALSTLRLIPAPRQRHRGTQLRGGATVAMPPLLSSLSPLALASLPCVHGSGTLPHTLRNRVYWRPTGRANRVRRLRGIHRVYAAVPIACHSGACSRGIHSRCRRVLRAVLPQLPTCPQRGTMSTGESFTLRGEARRIINRTAFLPASPLEPGCPVGSGPARRVGESYPVKKWLFAGVFRQSPCMQAVF